MAIINMSPPTDNRRGGARFSVFVRNKEATTLLKIRIYKTKHEYISIACNHTHINTNNLNFENTTHLSTDVVSWPKCPDWRLFHVAVNLSNFLSIADVHLNKTLVTREIPFSITELEIKIRQSDDMCTSSKYPVDVGFGLSLSKVNS